MHRAVIRIVVVSVMAICFVCPILQMLDHWDRGETKGKDTESTACLVALSVGLAIPVANPAFKTAVFAQREICDTDCSFFAGQLAVVSTFIPASQSPPVLRI